MLPIDVSITVQRTADMARTQTGEHVRNEAAQQQFAESLHREVHEQDQRIINTNRSERNDVNPDARGQGGYAKRKAKAPAKAAGSQAAKPKPASDGAMFDVSV